MTTARYPFPPHGGDTLRLVRICGELADHAHLTLVTLTQDDERRSNDEASLFRAVYTVEHPRHKRFLHTGLALLTGGSLSLAYFRTGRMRQLVRKLAPDHDLILSHLVRTGQAAVGVEGVARVLEMTDVISRTYHRAAALGRKRPLHLAYALEAHRLEHAERRQAAAFDGVSVISRSERRYLEERLGVPGHRITVAQNGVEVTSIPYRDPGTTEPVAALIGNMSAEHNVDAAEWFLEAVAPRIREEVPGFRVRVIGAISDAARRRLERFAGVEVTGSVVHTWEPARVAFCGLCPIRFGSGLQNKILEYLAMGLPVVSTPLGGEGIDSPARDVVAVAQGAGALADTVVNLWRDPDQRIQLARLGRRRVERHHAWEETLRPLVATVLELADAHR